MPIEAFDNTPPTAAALAVAAFDNTAPVAGALGVAGFDNTAPVAASLGVAAFDDTAPGAASVGPAGFDDTAPAGAVLQGYYADVRAVAQTNVTFASIQAGSSLGGVTLVAGDRFLLVAQDSSTSNGIWVANTGAEPTRPTDFDQPVEIVIGKRVRVTSGTGAGTTWGISYDGPLLYSQAPAAAALSVSAFSDAGPGAATLGVAGFDNTAPAAAAAGPGDFSNLPPEAIVIPGETAPTGGVQLPATPTVVAHTQTLAAGTNYLVQAGSRAAPVTVVLPDPAATGQWIIVSDASSQAATYPVTVDAGARDIDTAGTHTYVINRNDAVLELYWTGAKWKLL